MKSRKYRFENVSLSKHDPVMLIGSENFKKEVIEEEKPVLMLCILRSTGFYEQIDVLKNISMDNSEMLKGCMLEEEFVRAFSKKFRIRGTPTFLLFNKGKENGRMLGHADLESLTEFVSQTLALSLKR